MHPLGREPAFEKFELEVAKPSKADTLDRFKCANLSGEIAE